MSRTFDEAFAAGLAGMALVAQRAGPVFHNRAKLFAVLFLAKHGPATGETITDACLAAGIVPHNDKAFGPVLASLSRDRQIEKCGSGYRRKGHGAPGALLWQLTAAGRQQAEASPAPPPDPAPPPPPQRAAASRQDRLFV